MTLRVSTQGRDGPDDPDGPIATITIDNPGKRNAMSTDMWRQLPVLLESLRRVRVLVLTGADDVFCAGADIASLGDIGADPTVLSAAEEALAAFPHPTIARINGDCVGGGCQLALACDIRVAAPGARFGVTPARLGMVYPPGSTRRLAQTTGPANARWLLLTASLIPAGEALRMGLVHAVDADLDTHVAGLAGTLAARSRLSQAAAKDILAMIAGGAIDDDRAAGWMRRARDSGEAAEGAAAFLQRRPPRFPWRPHA